MTSTRALVALVTVALLVSSSPGADPDDRTRLLEVVRDRHREALDSVRTVSFAFEWAGLKSEPLHPSREGEVAVIGVGSSETGPGRYWQTPDRWRSTALWSDGFTLDELYRHHVVLTLRTPPDGVRTELTQLTREDATPWTRNGADRGGWLLFRHMARDTFASVPFHDLLEQPHTLHAVERLPTTDEVRVELSDPDGRYEFWFSPKHNHLIRKRVWHPTAEPQHRHEVEVTQFVEPNRGQFFPTTVESRSFDKERLKQHTRLTLTELQVNRPIPNDVFRLPNIAGMVCRDRAHNQSFRVDADGYRVGEFIPDEVKPNRPREFPAPGVPPSEQPDTILPWWAWAVIGVLLLCLTAAVMEIRRLKTPPPPGPSR